MKTAEPPKRKKKVKRIKKSSRQSREKSSVESAADLDRGAISLRPGLLVSLSARVRGGVHYEHADRRSKRDGETEITQWRTVRQIADREEYDIAVRIRNECRYQIARNCIATPFGLICVRDRFADLVQAIEEARAKADQHNRSARNSFVDIFVIRGRIEQTDTEAMRAIGGELKALLTSMQQGISEADTAAIREAANRAKQLGAMLNEAQQSKIAEAVETARKAARVIASVEKKGEDVQKAIQEIRLDALRENRFAFLDVDAESEAVDAVPTVDASRFDLDDEDDEDDD